ncbi:MAG: hypothetical protein ACK5M7_08865 [Draconibacterium sp.]
MKAFLITLLSLCFFSCSSPESKYEKIISDYLQTDKKGVKTDLKIKFLSLSIGDVFVSDSIAILQERYKQEKSKKVETAQESVTYWEETVGKHQKEGDDWAAKALLENSLSKLEKAKDKLKKANEWEPEYVGRYSDRTPDELLVKKADCSFSFFNPSLQIRQEINAFFIISKDENKCFNMIKKQKKSESN